MPGLDPTNEAEPGDPGRRTETSPRTPGLGEAVTLVRLALRAPRDPVPFLTRTARSVPSHLARCGVRLDGARAVDVGAGSGAIQAALRAAGAVTTALDIRDHRVAALADGSFVIGRGERTPFRDGAFDLVVSSNVLEHVPDPWPVLRELRRICREAGYVYVSWTNWLSPLGGHELSPFHYLGTSVATHIYVKTRGRPPRNFPGRYLFPVHVGQVLRGLHAGQAGDIDIVDLSPRYWPAFSRLAHVPGLREFGVGNCVVVFRPTKRRR